MANSTADMTAQVRLLSEGGAYGGVGYWGQVVSEDGAADNGAAHEAEVDVEALGQRQQHGGDGRDGAGGGAARGGYQHTGQKGYERYEARIQVKLGHQPDEGLDESALPEQLGKYAGKNECHRNRAEHGVLQALERDGAVGFLVLGEEEAQRQSEEGHHGQSGQSGRDDSVHYHAGQHEDDGYPRPE